MESRAAAENVILRLNGKNVRGWDGTESRVYLRIADTLDQRELRVRTYRPSSYSCPPASNHYSFSDPRLRIGRTILAA
jgi:hypothetical protein